MKTPITRALALFAITLLGTTAAPPTIATTVPPAGDGHESATVYFDFAGVTCIYAKVGRIVFWFEHGGKADPAQPMPGYLRIAFTTPNKLAEKVRIKCDGSEVFSQNDTKLHIPRTTAVAMSNAKAVSVILQDQDNTAVDTTFDDRDRENFSKLISWGKGWKHPTSSLLYSGPVGYAVLAGPQMAKSWGATIPVLERAVRARDGEENTSLFLNVADKLSLLPRNHTFHSAVEPEVAINALKNMQIMGDNSLTPMVAAELVNYSEDRNIRTLVLMLADVVPDATLDRIFADAARANLRVSAVWCEDIKINPAMQERLKVLTQSAGGILTSLD